MMGKFCGTVTGLFALVAGLAFLAQGLGYMSESMTNLVAGILLALFGLSFIIHKLDICPMEKMAMEKPMGKRM